jgi:predicted metal-dependent hydrolase
MAAVPLPMRLVDYVIAHEFAHMRIPGHRADFWRLLRRALPEYETCRAELDELGRRLWMGQTGGEADGLQASSTGNASGA